MTDKIGTGDYSGWAKHLYLLRGDSLDLEFDATTSFRIEATVRPASGTGGRKLTIVAKGGEWEQPGYCLKIDQGALYAQLCDGTQTIVARGTSPLNGLSLKGGWHDVAMDVDRENGYLRLYVDKALEASVDILGLGALTTVSSNIYYGNFRIGAGLSDVEYFEGDLDRVAVLVGITWVPESFWKTGEWLDQLTGPYIVKNHPGKTIFDLCPDPGWLDTHHAPAEEVEYINRKIKELGWSTGFEHKLEHHEEGYDPAARSQRLSPHE